jgi:hypothetical protein
MTPEEAVQKRGRAVWFKAHAGDTHSHLAVFIGTDVRGKPIIQLAEGEALTVGWDRLSEIFVY